MRRRPHERVLPPVRPNAGVEVRFRRRLESLVERMHRSVRFWVERAYRGHTPLVARLAADAAPKLTDAELDRLIAVAEGGQRRAKRTSAETRNLVHEGLVRQVRDKATGSLVYELTDAGRAVLDQVVTPAGGLRVVMKRVGDRWLRNFEAAAPRLATYFAAEVSKRSDAALRSILRDGGFSVKFQMTPTMQDVMDATVGEQVGLIRSIAQQHLGEVEGLVMRSVQAGRDLGPLARELRKRYGITKKRAALISRDQNNKATAAMTRVRRLELGINEALWMHSGAGKEPRPEHVKMSGKRFDVAKGMWDPRERKWVQPGELINCRCASRPVLPGFEP